MNNENNNHNNESDDKNETSEPHMFGKKNLPGKDQVSLAGMSMAPVSL